MRIAKNKIFFVNYESQITVVRFEILSEPRVIGIRIQLKTLIKNFNIGEGFVNVHFNVD